MAAFKNLKLAGKADQSDMAIGLRWISSMARSGRSIPLDDLQAIAQLPISIFGLHYGPMKQTDQQLYETWPNFYPTELELSDLAGLIMNLDCIVTTDTMTAHLAGALGRPTILLKPVFIDWRWSDTSTQSIWYDSMQVIRQDKIRDWSGAITQLVQELQRCLKT
jgi:ADP-heptose:LPS heptosyltransferase